MIHYITIYYNDRPVYQLKVKAKSRYDAENIAFKYADNCYSKNIINYNPELIELYFDINPNNDILITI